jgi:molybdopterin synthase sulfur carrier subunit
MATVVLSRNLQPSADGAVRVDVDPGSVRDVIRQLVERYPKLRPHLESGLAVSIDGEIIQEPLLEEVGPDSEVHFLPPISGGAWWDGAGSGPGGRRACGGPGGDRPR